MVYPLFLFPRFCCFSVYLYFVSGFTNHALPLSLSIYIYIYIYIYVCVCVCVCMKWVFIKYMVDYKLWIHIYVEHSISFKTFFVQAYKIVVDSWKFSMSFLYILWDDWPILMISGANELLQQESEYTLLKPDFHSW